MAMEISDLKIKSFGLKNKRDLITERIQNIKNIINRINYFLIIASTDTSQVEGISSAGIDSESRKMTPLADAEFLLFGPQRYSQYRLPLLQAGVTPALISHVCSNLLKAELNIIPIGLNRVPYFDYLKVEDPLYGPSKCLSSGMAMTKKRVEELFQKGFSTSTSLKKPIFISESVPGGTTTAQAIMEAFGLNVSDLVGSSMLNPPRKLKKEIINMGLLNANLQNSANVIDVIAALGDPFQAFSLGLIIGARKVKQEVILAGGSQMISLVLLALEFNQERDKQAFVDKITVITTDWLVRDDSLANLLNLIANKYNVELFGLASCLNFKNSKIKELNDYEFGHVKEGVGAGGFSLLAYLKGFSYEEIVSKCESNFIKMRNSGQITSINKNK